MFGGRYPALIWSLLVCALTAVAVASIGLAAEVGAAYPATPEQGQPHITDPYRHLSSVVAVSPEQVRREHGLGAGGSLESWARPLTPPTWGPNVDASLNNASAQNETTIAIKPEDSMRVIASANDYRANLKPWVYLSSDGGTSWSNYQVPGASPSLFYGDPAMVFGRNDRAYFGYLGYQSVCAAPGGMYISRSTDAGTTFSAPIQVAANSNDGTIAQFHDKEYVAVDAFPSSPYFGNVYEAWTKFVFRAGTGCGSASSQIEAPTVLTRSTDEGLTWSVPITASPPFSNNNQGTVPAVGRNGEVYLYYLGAQTQSQLHYDTLLFSRSTDGGQTFPFFTHIASIVDLPSPLPGTNFRNNAFGAIAVDQQIDGYLYAVWADYRNGDADILHSRSTDNGTTWSPPQRVNDDPVGNAKDQYFPWITTSPDGLVHATWHDEREDPGGAQYKAYYTYSTDRGVTWAANIAVSSAPSIPGSSTFIGDYSGIAANTGVVMPCWTDIRAGGNQNAYTARGVFGPKIASPTPSNTPTATHTATSTRTSTPTGTATPCPMNFSDVQTSDFFYVPVRYLYCAGVISGYADGTFRPYNNTTRGQMCKIVVLAFGIPTYTPPIPTFNDVPPTDPFYQYIETAAYNQIVSGYSDGTFRPFNNVTRGQLCKIVVIAAGWPLVNPPIPTFSDVPTTDPFYTYIETAYDHGIISGYADGTFRPGNNATRGQISKIVYEAVIQR